MTAGLRWRIITLQVVLVAVLAFAAGFLFWAGNYTHSTVHDQLAAQQIVFPARNDPGVTPAALTPCAGLPKSQSCPIPTGHSVGLANSNNMKGYAGQTMTTGDQAKVYANSFLQVHLSDMGYTYSGISGLALQHPTNAKYQALDATIFKGTTLRSMLLNAYGWWTVGSYAIYAAVGTTIAAIVVFGTLVFEALLAFGAVGAQTKRPSVALGQAVTA